MKEIRNGYVYSYPGHTPTQYFRGGGGALGTRLVYLYRAYIIYAVLMSFGDKDKPCMQLLTLCSRCGIQGGCTSPTAGMLLSTWLADVSAVAPWD